MKRYLVLGVYEQTFERFAESTYAESADDAEAEMINRFPGLLIAGVVAGQNVTVEA